MSNGSSAHKVPKPRIIEPGEKAQEKQMVDELRKNASEHFAKVDNARDLNALSKVYIDTIEAENLPRNTKREMLVAVIRERERRAGLLAEGGTETVKRSYSAGGGLVIYNVKLPEMPELKASREKADAVRNGDAVRKALEAVEVSGGESPRLGFIARNHEVRFTRKAYEQLEFLRKISEQGVAGDRVNEIPAYIIGRKGEEKGREHYLVTRIEMPPFNFYGDAVNAMPSLRDIVLQPGECFLGTFHTHPEGYSVLSALDITNNGIARFAYARPVGENDPDIMSGDLKGADQWHFNIIAPKGDKWRIFEFDPDRYGRLSEKYPVGKVGLARIEEMRGLECTPRDLK